MSFKPLLALMAVLPLHAEVVLPPLFSDHAVLQAGDGTPVWGTARDGEHVTVTIGGVSAATVAADGRWLVRLPALKASTTGQDLVVRGDNTVTVRDVLVGEVWLCSGQSNMERELGPRSGQPLITDWEKEAAAAQSPSIRFFTVKRTSPAAPIAVAEGTWQVVTPATVAKCSAVGWFFAQALHEARREPVGLVVNAWGGSTAEGWTSREALSAIPSLMDIVTKADLQIANYPGALAKFKAEEATLMAQWTKDVAAAKAAGKKEPGKPRPPSDPLGGYLAPMTRFNGMLHPLLPLGLRGVIWYQGESNVSRHEQYRTLLPTMLDDWRARWQRPDLPLLMVELAPYKGSKPDFREVQQRLAREIPGVGLVTTVDVGDSNDIHPPNKRPVGERLALLARKQVYGEDVVASGPRFANATFPAGKAVVTFTDLAGGLVASGGVLKGFTLAGADGKFMDATATIVGETVEVTAPGVAAPTAVRYAWAPAPVATLTSKAGLPAFPFRSDQPGL